MRRLFVSSFFSKLLCKKFEYPVGGDINYSAFIQAIDSGMFCFKKIQSSCIIKVCLCVLFRAGARANYWIGNECCAGDFLFPYSVPL